MVVQKPPRGTPIKVFMRKSGEEMNLIFWDMDATYLVATDGQTLIYMQHVLITGFSMKARNGKVELKEVNPLNPNKPGA